MKILAVETATAWQSVALLDGERVVARHDQDAAGSHAKLLLPAIDRLFSESGYLPAQLDGLVVSIGPGSFTGLRVGLATVLGIRTITQLPLAVVPTLEGMAWNLRNASHPICPVINSRRGELYWALFQWRGKDRLDRLAPEQVGDAGALAKQLSGPVTMGNRERRDHGECGARGRSHGSGGTEQTLRRIGRPGRPPAVVPRRGGRPRRESALCSTSGSRDQV